MKTEQITQRLNSILERNSDRKVNKLIPEDIRQLKTSIKELKQVQSLPVDSVSKQREQFFALLKYAMPANYKGLALERIVESYINEANNCC